MAVAQCQSGTWEGERLRDFKDGMEKGLYLQLARGQSLVGFVLSVFSSQTRPQLSQHIVGFRGSLGTAGHTHTQWSLQRKDADRGGFSLSLCVTCWLLMLLPWQLRH